jgi:hypothetical protein
VSWTRRKHRTGETGTELEVSVLLHPRPCSDTIDSPDQISPDTHPYSPTHPDTQPFSPTHPDTQPYSITYPNTQPSPTYPDTLIYSPTHLVTQPYSPTYPDAQPYSPTYHDNKSCPDSPENQKFEFELDPGSGCTPRHVFPEPRRTM